MILDWVIRHAAAGQLGMATVPCVVLSHLDQAAQRAARIAFNRMGERGAASGARLVGVLAYR